MFFTLKRSRRRDQSRTREEEVKTKIVDSPVSIVRQYEPYHYHPSRLSNPTTSRSLHIKYHFIHRLPQEILAHIFLLGEEDNEMFPVAVSHVCRVWRELSLRTPALWLRIVLNRRGDMWMERINRARACPLDVQLRPCTTSIRGHRRPQMLDMHSVQWYMHLVTPFISRWRSLEIIFSNYSPFLWNYALAGCCETGRKCYAPLVEEISLIHPSNDDSKEFTLFGGYAPRLRRATVDGIRLAWLPSLFSNLTFLNYTHHGFTRGRPAVSELLSILSTSRSLSELHVLFPDKLCSKSSRYHAPQTLPLVLPSLVSLHLHVDGPDIPIELLTLMAHLSTPALTSITLNDQQHSHLPFPYLDTFFRAFHPPQTLRTLRVESGWNDQDMIPTFVRRLPKLREYAIRVSGRSERRVDLVRWRRELSLMGMGPGTAITATSVVRRRYDSRTYRATPYGR